MATEEQIRKLAYRLWEEEGHPQGKDVEHYFTAKHILEKGGPPIIELSQAPIPELLPAPKRVKGAQRTK